MWRRKNSIVSIGLIILTHYLISNGATCMRIKKRNEVKQMLNYA